VNSPSSAALVQGIRPTWSQFICIVVIVACVAFTKALPQAPAQELFWDFNESPPLSGLSWLPVGWTTDGNSGTAGAGHPYGVVPWSIVNGRLRLGSSPGGFDAWVQTPPFRVVDPASFQLSLSLGVSPGSNLDTLELSILLAEGLGEIVVDTFSGQFVSGQRTYPDPDVPLNLDPTKRYVVRARAYNQDDSEEFPVSIDNFRLTSAAFASPLPEVHTHVLGTWDWHSAASWSPAAIPGPNWNINVINSHPTEWDSAIVTKDSSINKLTMGATSGLMTVYLEGGTLSVADSVVVGHNGILEVNAGRLETPRVDLQNGNLKLGPAASGFSVPLAPARGSLFINNAGNSSPFQMNSRIAYSGSSSITVSGAATFTERQIISTGAHLTVLGGNVGIRELDGPLGDLTIDPSASLELNTARVNDLTVRGTLTAAPDSAGRLAVDVAEIFDQKFNGTLVFKSSGTQPNRQYGRMTVGQSARLDGTVAFVLEGGFKPQIGQSFELISAPFVSGEFTKLLLPTLPGSAAFRVNSASGLSITMVAAQQNEWRSQGIGPAWSDNSNWQRSIPETHHDALLINTSDFESSVYLDVNATVHGVRVAGPDAPMTFDVWDRTLVATDKVVVESGGELRVNGGAVTSSAIELRGGKVWGIGSMSANLVVDEGSIDVPAGASGLKVFGGVTLEADGTLVKTGVGTMTVNGVMSGPGNLEVRGGAVVAGAGELQSLKIAGANSIFRLQPGSGTMVVDSLALLASLPAPESDRNHGAAEAIPEPAAGALSVIGILCLLFACRGWSKVQALAGKASVRTKRCI
jgi:hypothetical protein